MLLHVLARTGSNRVPVRPRARKNLTNNTALRRQGPRFLAIGRAERSPDSNATLRTSPFLWRVRVFDCAIQFLKNLQS